MTFLVEIEAACVVVIAPDSDTATRRVQSAVTKLTGDAEPVAVKAVTEVTEDHDVLIDFHNWDITRIPVK